MWVDVYLCSLARDFSKKIDNKKDKKEKMSSIHKKQIKSRVHPAPPNVWVQWCLHIPPRNRTEASRLLRTADLLAALIARTTAMRSTLTPVTLLVHWPQSPEQFCFILLGWSLTLAFFLSFLGNGQRTPILITFFTLSFFSWVLKTQLNLLRPNVNTLLCLSKLILVL